jgi:hypothetical protein
MVALAEIAIGLTSYLGLLGRDRLDHNFRFTKKIIETAAHDRVSAPVNDSSSFNIAHCGKPASLGLLHGPRKRWGFRLIPQNRHNGGSIDNHRGNPFSS